MELVERQGLLGDLERFAAEARSGQGRMVLIGGEAGVGKTSLVQTFVSSGLPARRVLWGSCDPLVTPEPLAPFRDARPLRRVLAANPRRVDLLEALLDELARTPPTVMVLDDVHWADEATLDVLRYLGRRVHTTTGMLVVTFREEEAGTSPGLRTAVGDLATAPGTRRLRVQPLTAAGVAELAANTPIEPSRLFAATNGNPFYVTEVLAAPGWTVPATVSDAVLARVARLGPDARALVEVISLSPGGLEPAIAGDVSSAEPSVADAAVELGVLVVAGDRLAFRHELARLAVEAAVPVSRRRRLHARLLAHLEAATPIDAARATHHAAAAGDAAAVLRHAAQAAREASARGGHRAAAEQFARAAGAAAVVDVARAGELLSAEADERQRFDDPVAVLELRRQALEARRRTGDREGEAHDLLEMARLMEPLSDAIEGKRLARQATEILESLPPGPELARAYGVEAWDAMTELRFDDALRAASRALALAKRTESMHAAITALRVRGSVLTLRGTNGADGMATYQELRALALETGNQEALMIASSDPANDLLALRQFDDARRLLSEALELGRAADLDRRVVAVESQLAVVAFAHGHWDEAEAMVRRIRPGQRARTDAADDLATLGRIGVRRGTPGAVAQLEEARELGRRGPDYGQWDPVAGLAEAAWLGGRPEAIPGLVGDLFAAPHAAGLRWPAGELAFWLWRGGALPDPPLDLAKPYADQIAGDWRAAARAWERIGCPYEEADALADGDEAAMRRALELFTQLGAVPAADRLRARMREAGMTSIPARPRASTRDAPAHLTRRQLEILGLLADGLTDREIAERLFITEKTAGHHVSAVLAKLDVRSRVEAAVVARKMGIAAP